MGVSIVISLVLVLIFFFAGGSLLEFMLSIPKDAPTSRLFLLCWLLCSAFFFNMSVGSIMQIQAGDIITTYNKKGKIVPSGEVEKGCTYSTIVGRYNIPYVIGCELVKERY